MHAVLLKDVRFIVYVHAHTTLHIAWAIYMMENYKAYGIYIYIDQSSLRTA